jgi:hypothetical protein
MILKPLGMAPASMVPYMKNADTFHNSARTVIIGIKYPVGKNI